MCSGLIPSAPARSATVRATLQILSPAASLTPKFRHYLFERLLVCRIKFAPTFNLFVVHPCICLTLPLPKRFARTFLALRASCHLSSPLNRTGSGRIILSSQVAKLLVCVFVTYAETDTYERHEGFLIRTSQVRALLGEF